MRVIAFDTALLTSGPLAYLMGCSIATNHSNKVCYLSQRMVLTEATGDA